LLTKAQELVKWFTAHGTNKTQLWELDEFLEDADQKCRDVVSQSRWMTTIESIYGFDDDSYVKLSWSKGSTEYQKADPNIRVWEVEPFTQAVIRYRVVNG